MSEELTKQMAFRLCECGCGGYVKEGQRFIRGHNMIGKGHVLSDETKREKTEKCKETRRINQEIKLGIRPAPEPKYCECGCGEEIKEGKKFAVGHNLRGTHHTEEEEKRKLSEMNTGEKHPMFGTHPSKKSRQKMSISQMGNPGNCVCKGEKNVNWNGGTSFEPYCPLFNDNFKERVRNFFDRKCVLCGIPENGRKLSVHHNKDTCCDNSIPLFVPLCQKCHSKTNSDREYYENFFTKLIMEKYNGECYMPKENK